MIDDILNKTVLILGCGNVLFGDDGFGPEMIAHLEAHYTLPETVLAQDIGTGLRDFLFDLMIAPTKPKRIFILDAICLPDRKAGELFEIDLEQLSAGKPHGGFFHQFPTLGQLQELKGLTGVEFRILAVQTGEFPDTVRPGFSPEVKEAIPRACDWLIKEIGSE